MTDGLESQDAEHKRQISQASEDEEQRVETLCALPAVIEQQLWHATAQVQYSAEVAEDLARDGEL